MENNTIDIVKEWFEAHFAHRISMTPGTPDHDYYKAALVKLEARLNPSAETQPEKQEN